MPPAAKVVQSTVENCSVLTNISPMENGVREPASSAETDVVKSLGSTVASVLVNKLDCMVKPASLAREKQTDSNKDAKTNQEPLHSSPRK